MEAANDSQNLLTFNEWFTNEPRNFPVVPEKVYFGREIPVWHYVYREIDLKKLNINFAVGEAPVICFGSLQLKRTSIKWHYSDKVLTRFMRMYKILMFTHEHKKQLIKYIYSKKRNIFHNFEGALKQINIGEKICGTIEILVYGKLLRVPPERYEMIMWLHKEEKRFSKLP
jgi:hypothetical protein